MTVISCNIAKIVNLWCETESSAGYCDFLKKAPH